MISVRIRLESNLPIYYHAKYVDRHRAALWGDRVRRSSLGVRQNETGQGVVFRASLAGIDECGNYSTLF